MGIYDREYVRDDEEPSGLRRVFGSNAVTTLIVLNVAVALADMLIGDRHWLANLLSAHPDTLTQPWLWWQFLTYGFVHDPNNLNHIIFNMFGLWCFGTAMEERYGKKEFLWFYLVAITLGGIVWGARGLLSGGGHSGLLLGASGGVTAVIMLFVFLNPMRTILLFMVIPVPAWILGTMMIVGDLVGNRLPSESGGRVAYDVHLVGAAFAAAYFWFGWNFFAVRAVAGLVFVHAPYRETLTANQAQSANS